ncbi:toll/interleukin-1 receptor domain-containing protein [Paenibacillus sp. FSL R7-0333]|uniref:toll/interleukin-1 receptor domain-containing protein n=1 Tax=Paenibacillus sp. FSL R7-0333 TaxID=1926587 RepID=UPI00096F0385|nr:hypothetical protein BK146_10245 [Paenibacillus sp. FSL R7-0333]
MDAFKKLTYDVPGIQGVIRKYTGEPYISNITDQLVRAVGERKLDEVIYFLELINDWYVQNQSRIQSNEYVTNHNVHLALEQKVKDYISELKNLVDSQIDDKSTEDRGKEEMKIFVSHSSKDKSICDAFVELMEAIGVPEEMILYTSSARYGIPGDLDIFDYLRQNLSGQTTVFFMLSDNYYESVYCLNEMGAAWIARNDFSTFILPNFSGEIRGVIDRNKKGYSLMEPIDLIQFKNKLLESFEINLSENKWEDIKNNFIEKLRRTYS